MLLGARKKIKLNKTKNKIKLMRIFLELMVLPSAIFHWSKAQQKGCGDELEATPTATGRRRGHGERNPFFFQVQDGRDESGERRVPGPEWLMPRRPCGSSSQVGPDESKQCGMDHI
jgi:hypothetical protein